MLNKFLITKNRIDIIIGIEYVDYYENNYNTNFFIDLYIEHKYSWNKLKEGSYKGKSDFLNRFNTLIESIKKNNGNNVEIGIVKCKDEHWVINGFHRSSILYYYNLPAKTKIKELPEIKYYYYPTDIYFFKNKKPGTICNLDIKYCNYTMLCFFKQYYKHFNIIILFPNKKNLSLEIQSKINNNIIYDLNFPINELTNNFRNNFIKMLYYNDSWCKGGGYKKKAELCFNEGDNLKILFIKKQPINEINDIKNTIRKYYNKGKNSVHTPDTQNECNDLLQLLNKNTISYLCKTPSLYIKFPNFNKLFKKLKEFCSKNNINTKKICITSSSVLSVYGIRDCVDMDLFIDKKYIDIFKKTCFDNHNNYTINKHYPKHFEDIIYNPDNHFYFQSFKFCNLNIIYEYKKYRIEHLLYGKKSLEKDQKDINSIIDNKFF